MMPTWLDEIEERFSDTRLTPLDASSVALDLCRHLRKAWEHQDRLYDALVSFGPPGWAQVFAEHVTVLAEREHRWS